MAHLPAAVSLGVLILVAIYVKVGVALVRATHRKRSCIDQQTLDPSQMSEQEIEEGIDSQINEVARGSPTTWTWPGRNGANWTHRSRA
ncbi:MAG: hypothetical protein R3C45_09815 [Phycisphaerales bacterium]